MHYSIAHIGTILKEARKQKKLSQRALSAKIGVPQGHISRIENGVIDLQISSLIEISRALDLELMLVPSKLVPAFQAFQLEKKENRQIPAYLLEPERGEND